MFLDFSKKEYKFRDVHSRFKPVFSKEEIEYIIDTYFPDAFNTGSVRLDSIDIKENEIILNLAKTDFYSLLVSNILYRKEFFKETKQVKEFKKQPVNDFSVLDNKNFSNNLAISVLIEDLNNNKLIVKRAKNLAIGSSLFSVSVTGGVDLADLEENNPVFSAVKRETMEELGIIVNDDDIVLDGIYIGPQKQQPIALCTVKLKDTFEVYGFNGKDTDFEIEEFFIVPEKTLSQFLNFSMTEATKFQIESVLGKL